MKRARGVAVACSLLSAPALAQLAEYGIEGIWTVSTRDAELRGSVAPDGKRMVWGSDRAGGPGGGDLWQARNENGRWLDPQPLPFNTAALEAEPMFSADGRWLYFVSDRTGGAGGRDLYRVAVGDGGGFGTPQRLRDGINTRGNERSPTPAADGQGLLFSSDRRGGAGGYDLYRASLQGAMAATPLPGVNTTADEIDAAWLDGGRALLFSRGDEAAGIARLYVAACDGSGYAGSVPWTLSFNTGDGYTRAPVADPSRPGEGTVTGSARSPGAGKSDLYRIVLPTRRGGDGCLPPAG
ncbi:PD40 domain-containing protein [Pseudoxanthomonas sp. NC8]|nr:PD40 domain-containing protein [Pseudoxanthomonas sp. NC8]